MRFMKNGDGDGLRQTITAPIAEFRGDDIVARMLFTMTIRVSSPPHKVGDRWEMIADGVVLERK